MTSGEFKSLFGPVRGSLKIESSAVEASQAARRGAAQLYEVYLQLGLASADLLSDY